jgi:uncharacterized PurR-regulated membrane protein YhhQ (DUF165 family)
LAAAACSFFVIFLAEDFLADDLEADLAEVFVVVAMIKNCYVVYLF